MNEYMEEYYTINKQCLSYIGGWPYQRKTLRVFLSYFLLVIQSTSAATEMLLMFKHSDDVDLIVEGFVLMLLMLMAVSKLLNIAVNNDKLEHLLRAMNDHWTIFDSKSELHILRYYADMGRKVAKYYTAYTYTALLLFLMFPLIPRVLDIVMPLNESRPLVHVYEGEYLINKEKHYYPILLYTCAASTTLVMITSSIDSTLIVCVLHACSLFVAVGNRLENIINKDEIEINVGRETCAESNHPVFAGKCDCDGYDDYRKLLVCLKKHQLALKYVQMLNGLFTNTTLALLIMSLIIMSVEGIQVINKFGHGADVIRYVNLSIATFIHLLTMCFPGQVLIDRSTDVFDKAYSSQWYSFSSRSKQLLSILLYRSMVPSTLLAGRMYVMSMAMYSSVLQTAMSYFTTFLSMK